MGQKVIWATSALEDLEAAAEFIHRDSPAYGASFVTRTLQAARSLSDLPERGRRIPEIRDKAIREVYIQSYRLIYRIEKNQNTKPDPVKKAEFIAMCYEFYNQSGQEVSEEFIERHLRLVA